MRTICVYHANCYDGICAAWVVSKVYPNAEFVPMQYGMPATELQRFLPQESDEIRIIIVDFSFRQDEMIWLSGAREILVLDHHKTAQKECEGLKFCKFDLNESGASLAWKYFFPKQKIPILIEYIKDRDLWLWKMPDSKYINDYIQCHDLTIESMQRLADSLEIEVSSAALAGNAINMYKKASVKRACETAWLEDIAGFFVPCVNATGLISEIGNQLCLIHPDKPFAASFFVKDDGSRVYSLRSIGDFDVSEVAKRFGGGGHKNAAGFIVK